MSGELSRDLRFGILKTDVQNAIQSQFAGPGHLGTAKKMAFKTLYGTPFGINLRREIETTIMSVVPETVFYMSSVRRVAGIAFEQIEKVAFSESGQIHEEDFEDIKQKHMDAIGIMVTAASALDIENEEAVLQRRGEVEWGISRRLVTALVTETTAEKWDDVERSLRRLLLGI